MSSLEVKEMIDTYVMHTYGRVPLAIAKGSGAILWDFEGNEYLDLIGGLAVNNLGHCHPEVVKALQKQAEELWHVSNLFYTKPQGELAKKLFAISGGYKSFFCNSGAEANEAAIKLARKYGKKVGGADKFEIITMQKSFHGRTIATITATGQEKYQKDFTPVLAGFKYVPLNDLAAFKETINENTCAVMLEAIQGEGGVNVPTDEFINGVAELAQKYNCLLIFDEVQCGFGRTGKTFGFEHFGIKPDIFTLAKGLGNGTAIGAALAKPEIAATFAPGDHASTFGGNPIACAAANAVLDVMERDNIVKVAAEKGEYLKAKLAEMQEKYPVIVEVRGKGLMIGLELTIPAKGIQGHCFEKGILVNCVGEKTLRFIPPLVIEYAQIDKLLKVLDEFFSAGR